MTTQHTTTAPQIATQPVSLVKSYVPTNLLPRLHMVPTWIPNLIDLQAVFVRHCSL